MVCAHWRFDQNGKRLALNAFGSEGEKLMLSRELAVTALWVLYAVEVCRLDQPRAVQVAEMGTAENLPVDLRSSDQRPEQQPNDH